MNIVKLKNGKRVANFSSPHPFTFDDGTVLPAVSPELSKELSLTPVERVIDYNTGDMKIHFELTPAILMWVDMWQVQWKQKNVDVVFCPYPMIEALRKKDYKILQSPFRTIRTVDRQTKEVSSTFQCL